ncbi:unnamed protein product [Brachionus calyciflorus]|uniref:G-protein coupled receptors family 1 profile domain-containing protein n=1 Tax=Brachionus calyciflorus TaxID=104777 RepID=A0A814NXZ0_9BILA|nr:unnamed protein product [Brachionus calyciflorus]
MNISNINNNNNVDNPNCLDEVCYSTLAILVINFLDSYVYKMMIGLMWLSLVFFGVLGNGLVIFIAISYKKLNDITNCYIFNLAITDLLFVLFCIPFTTYIYLFDNWFFGITFCKLNHFMSHASVQSTCLTLTAMTIHRCNLIIKNKAMTHHIARIKRRQKTVLLITICIWIVSFLVSSPDLIYYTVTEQNYESSNETIKACSFDETTYSIFKSYISISHIVSIATTYVIPLLVIVLSYTRLLSHLSKNQRRLAKFSRDDDKKNIHKKKSLLSNLNEENDTRRYSSSAQGAKCLNNNKSKKIKKSENRKKKVTTMVAVVTLNFGICWLPTHLFIILKTTLGDSNPQLLPYLSLFKLFAHTLSYLTPVINPCLYAFYNENFRSCFYDLWFRMTCKSNKANMNSKNNLAIRSNSKSVF